MKKIGIISLFGYNNYGNRLQLFAVQKVYKSLGFDSEIIKYTQKTPKDPLFIQLKVLVFKILFLRATLSHSYLKNKRVKNFKTHAKLNYKELKNYVNPLKIDSAFQENYTFFSVGSDQIWGWFTHSISNFVFLKFAPQEKRITFSPSFGSSKIEEKYKEVFIRGLEGFENISVREESGAKIIKEFTGENATVLCDPTMCLSKNEWLNFASPHKKKPKENFILTYFLGEKSSQVETLIATFSEDYQVINLNSLKSPELYAVTPSEWVDYINSASLFLTDSFHGVVFSIVLQTPFSVYRRVGGEDMQTRITNILGKFSLGNRFELLENNLDLFNLNFTNTAGIIEIEKTKVEVFLNKALKKRN